MEKVIKIYKGEETGIIRENYASRGNSIFAEQYEMALEAIKSYIIASKTEDEDNVYDRSNIFAFIGDRGTGKTSCMQSVAGMFGEFYRKEVDEDFSCLILPIVDPTIFDDKTNILQVILGVLFKKFKTSVTEDNGCNDKFEKKKNSVIEAFQSVKKCLGYISKPSDLIEDGDDISKIDGMASVSRLHSLMNKLIECYLEFFDKDVLFLQVDDIDLQTKHAYRMVDEIRKYFVLKKVVVLMSFKLEQLSKVVELENAKNYKPLLDLNLITPSDIQEIAAKYILKLIPINQRIFMPTFEVYADSLIEYYQSHNEGEKSLIGNGYPISVKYAVTTLIYQKCRFLFYHSKGVVSPIVPRNLRELRHLLALLVEMPDNSSDDISQNKHNKSIFLKYFYSTWISNNISAKDQDIVKNISQVRDAATINKIVIQQLQTKYLALFYDESKEIEPFAGILSEKNASYNVSLADVYTVVDFIRNRMSGVDDRMLMFFISTFYSLKLYEYYDELTDSVKDKGKSSSEEHKKKYPDVEIRKEEKTDKINNYQLLIGGCFVNSDIYKFIPNGKEQTQGKIKINYELLRKSAKAIIDGIETDVYKINLVELFTLCTYRLFETKEIGNKKFRTSNNIYYDFNSGREYNSVEFDLGAFFFNIIDVERAYNRVNPILFSRLSAEKISLYKKLLERCKTQRGLKEDCSEVNKKLAMLSCTAIRNYEVLSDFIRDIEYSWTDRSKGSMIENLCDFFKKVAAYKINLYVRKKEKKQLDRENLQPTAISFEYADAMATILEEISKMDADDEKKEEYYDFTAKLFSVKVFDVDEVMKSFNGRLYSVERIKEKICKACEAYIKEDNRLVVEIDVWINYLMGSNNTRVSPADIRRLMQRLKVVYESEDE